ncbi:MULTISPECIES: ABC transporter ATP-binding protein [unclassified Microbacterium]|uniref:ABC transporter ATP-binding protein n=1 Tax=unclassified Microbacterium TaxID=2609290 RepID=UPI000EA923B3|nr:MULTISPECIES: ABC transporter ATP-binding protein [unclassified Microbacterium]MBT2484430.1 ABC transporter ATP-binding protein [Microbacterium sp. ISL-108]RKN67339.1 ABC transporter ATP-binding protein [Microbacterium sp. CGR2]
MSPAIELTQLHKNYGHRTAVDSLNMSVDTGSVFGLIGPNGAGKTTTLRMIVDVIRPTSGSVRVLGEDPRIAGPDLRRRVGFIPGELRLDGRMTGRRMLDFYAEVSGPVPAGMIDRLASRLGLDLSRQVRTLSKGNKQKLGIVQAFMHEPELLVLDEPTSGLDPLVQREFLQLVREARERGQTVLLSSHVLSEIQQTADAVAVLSAGRIVAEGDVASLRLGAIRRVRAGLTGVDEETLRRELAELPHLADIEVVASGEAVRLSATVEGDIDPFVKAIARHRIVDLAVEEPDLEESVLRLYGDQSTATKGDGDA